MLYECLTGRPPFRGASALETIRQVTSEEPASPSKWRANLPRDLETICLKCLEKKPDNRYQSAEHLADDLRRFRQARNHRRQAGNGRFRPLKVGQASARDRRPIERDRCPDSLGRAAR